MLVKQVGRAIKQENQVVEEALSLKETEPEVEPEEPKEVVDEKIYRVLQKHSL